MTRAVAVGRARAETDGELAASNFRIVSPESGGILLEG